MIRNQKKRILSSTQTEGDEFRGNGVCRIWVRGAGGTYPSSETVTLQEYMEIEGETPTWVNDPSSDAEWTAEDKKFCALVPGAKYRLVASDTGFVAQIDTFADNSSIVV